MKEATGELNMTVITVVAIAAIGLLFYNFIWPMIKVRLIQNTCDSMGSNWEATKCTVGDDGSATATGSSGATYSDCQAAEDDEAGGSTYCCCKVSTTN